jgi:hypothetical protein
MLLIPSTITSNSTSTSHNNDAICCICHNDDVLLGYHGQFLKLIWEVLTNSGVRCKTESGQMNTQAFDAVRGK